MRPEISESELIVLQALWQRSPLRSGEIVEAVAAKKEWHKKTINTLIRRLVEKGAVEYTKAPGGFLYSPVLQKKAYRKDKAQKLLRNLFDGELSPLLTSFLDSKDLSNAELKELRQLVDRISKK